MSSGRKTCPNPQKSFYSRQPCRVVCRFWNMESRMVRVMLLAFIVVCSLSQLVDAGPNPTPRIAWYGSLADGLAEAQQSGRPILLISGAPSCLGVPGVW